MQFLSTPSARRATLAIFVELSDFIISIHALREEGDLTRQSTPHMQCSISIHALREEGDSIYSQNNFTKEVFLSTPSARRATQWASTLSKTGEISIHALREEGDLHGHTDQGKQGNFYPRPPRGGRRSRGRTTMGKLLISIHALREEGDPVPEMPCSLSARFLSTPSARRATRGAGQLRQAQEQFLSTPSARRATLPKIAQSYRRGISIHALREEGDR